MLPDDAAVLCAQRPRGEDVLLILIPIELHSRPRRHTDPPCDEEGDEQHQYLTRPAHMQFEQGNDDHRRHGSEDIGNAFHHEVDLTAVIAFDGAVHGAEDKVDGSNDDREDEGEPRARSKAGQNILPGTRRPEEEVGLGDAVLQHIAVIVDIILVVIDAHFHARRGAARIGIVIRLAVFADKPVLSLDAHFGSIAVGGLRARLIRPIDGDDVPVFIIDDLRAVGAFRLVIVVGVVLILQRLGTVGRADGGIDDLSSRLILIPHEVLVLLRGEVGIDHARLMIAVEAVMIHILLVDGELLVLDGIVSGLLPHRVVIHEGELPVHARLAAVPEGRFCKHLVLGQRHDVVGIVICNGVLREEGHDDGKEHQKEDDARADDRTLVLAEAREGVAHIAARLGLELLVVRNIARICKLEFFLRDVGVSRVFHVTLPPFVFSGR